MWRRAGWKEAAGCWCWVPAQLAESHRALRGTCSSPRIRKAESAPLTHPLSYPPLLHYVTCWHVQFEPSCPTPPRQCALLLWVCSSGVSAPLYIVSEWRCSSRDGASCISPAVLAEQRAILFLLTGLCESHALHFSYRCYRRVPLWMCTCSYSCLRAGFFGVSVRCHMQVWLNWGKRTASHPSSSPQAQRCLSLHSHGSTMPRLLLSLQPRQS